MKKLLVLLLICGSAMSADIRLIYPRMEAGQDSFFYPRDLDSTFVLGHIEGFMPQMSLTCNSFPVNLTEDGAFLAFLPIPWQNETLDWTFALTKGGAETSKLVFPFSEAPEPLEIVWREVFGPSVCRINQPNAHTRTEVGGSYHLFPDSGTVIFVQASSENWYKIATGGKVGVIERHFADSLDADLRLHQRVRVGNAEIRRREDKVVLDFKVNRQPLYEVVTEPEGDELVLLVYDAVSFVDRIRYVGAARDIVGDLTWQQQANMVVLNVFLKEYANGYRVFSTDSSLTLEIYPAPPASKSLRGKRIALDPGHGGAADGAIGPRGTKEKDAVLRWSEVLEKELRAKGAEVLRTRNDDSAVGLHDRVAKAREFKADVYLSLHANALPDGENPFERRGCGTYYYQSLSRSLAESIQSALLDKTGLNDDGVCDANFAVVRPTDFPAVLIEAAYMMHPEEELKLIDDRFLLDLSRGVENGLLDYFSKVPAR